MQTAQPPTSTHRPTLEEMRARLRAHLPELEADYGVRSLALFGSWVRHQERADSDLDVLVSFNKVPGLIRFSRLENELSDLLGLKVDLVPRDALKPRIGERILREAVTI